MSAYADTRRKIKAVLCIATLVGAEMRVRQAARKDHSRFGSNSQSSGSRKSDGLEVAAIFRSRAIPSLQERSEARAFPEQMHGRTQRFAEQLGSMRAKPSLVDRMHAIIPCSPRIHAAADVMRSEQSSQKLGGHFAQRSFAWVHEYEKPTNLIGERMDSHQVMADSSFRPQDTVVEWLVNNIVNRSSRGGKPSPLRTGFDKTVLGKSTHPHFPRDNSMARLEENIGQSGQGVTKATGLTVLSTSANIVTTVVGAGVLSLPWAFYYSSLVPAVIFSGLLGFLAALNFFFLGLCSEKTGLASYSAIWARCFGKRAGLASDMAIASCCFGNLASYLIIAGDFMPRGLSGLGCKWAPLQNRHLAIVSVFTVLLPLDFQKDLSILGYTSIFGALAAFYTAGMLSVEGVKFGSHASDWRPCDVKCGWFLMIPAVAFAFNGHFNAPQVYQELANHSPKRWLMVTVLSFSLCLLISASCGVSGYIMFGSGLALPGRSNVLTAPAFDGIRAAQLAYFSAMLASVLAYPFNVQSLCTSLESILLNHAPSGLRKAMGEVRPDVRRHGISAMCVFLSLAVALSTDDLGLMNDINGAICGCLLAFVFPSMMYLKCTENGLITRWLDYSATTRACLTRWIPWMCITSGTTVGICGVCSALLVAYGVKVNR